MATNKKIVQVDSTPLETGPAQGQTPRFTPTAENKGRATGLRTFAAVLWVLAIAAEGAAIYVLLTTPKPITTHGWVWMIGLLVIDLVLVIVGSSMWKRANRLDPASRAQPTRFFVQNQLGVIISIIAFLPMVVLVFTDKDLTGKEKGILGGVAAALLLVAGFASADFSPPSVEQYTEQSRHVEQLTGANHVFWTRAGNHYHLYSDCQHINTSRTEQIFEGTVAQARELKNITELCKTCEARAQRARLTGGLIPE